MGMDKPFAVPTEEKDGSTQDPALQENAQDRPFERLRTGPSHELGTGPYIRKGRTRFWKFVKEMTAKVWYQCRVVTLIWNQDGENFNGNQ